MKKKAYPDETVWIAQQRQVVLDYLSGQSAKHGDVAQQPDWYLSPYLSVWRIESSIRDGAVGYWAIAGDCPTDYLSGHDAGDARQALFAFAKLWKEAALLMRQGKEHPTVSVGTRENREELGELLLSRSKLLLEFAADDGLWGSR